MYNIGERRCDKIMKIQYNSKSNWNFDSSYNSIKMKIAFVDKRHLMWLNKQRTEPPLSQMIKLVI